MTIRIRSTFISIIRPNMNTLFGLNRIFGTGLLRTHSFVFFAVHKICRIFLSPFVSKTSRRVFYCSWVSSFHSCMFLQAILALSLLISLLKLVCCDFSVFSTVMPDRLPLCLTWYRIASYTQHLLQSWTQGTYGNISSCSSCSFWMSLRHTMPSTVLSTLMSRLYLWLTWSGRSTNYYSSASEVANRIIWSV